MFIRRKYEKNRNRTRVQIVHNFRENHKVRQRVIKTVGTAHSDEQLLQLEATAAVMLEEIRLVQSRQGSLFSAKELAQMVLLSKQPKPTRKFDIDVSECDAKARLSVGIREAYGQVYRNFGWQRLLGARRRAGCRILKELVLARISNPRSKRRTVLDLCTEAGIELNLDQVYQTMDLIDDKCVTRIQQDAWDKAQLLLGKSIQVLFYDVTTLYFESEREGPMHTDTEDETVLRFKGYSKDGKHHRCQILLALLMTEEGLALGYELYPGNTYEGHTLQDSLASLGPRYGHRQITVVADSGQLNKDNQRWLESQDIPYVLGFRMKSAPAAVKAKILDASRYLRWDGERGLCDSIQRYQVIEYDGKRIVVSYSEKRARKDRHNRQKALTRLNKKLSQSKQPASVAHQGYARYLDFPASGEICINAHKIAEAERWDGLRAIVAQGNSSYKATELLAKYRQLWQIEHGFRVNKHDLRIRPIYHWTTRRIRAHLAICFMAFCCVQYLCYRLKSIGHPMSAEHIARELNSVQNVVLAHTESERKFVMPMRASEPAKRIYRCLNLTRDEKTYELTPAEKRKLH